MKPSALVPHAGLALVAILAAACRATPPQAGESPQARTPAATSRPTTAVSRGGATARGKVVEVLNSAGYTYVRLESPGPAELWAATTAFTVSPGDEGVFSTSMPMEHFESRTLARRFDVVYFADAIEIVRPDISSLLRPGLPATPTTAPGHAAGSAAGVTFEGIENAPGGLTVAEILEQAEGLAGRDVAVRGRVVKFTGGVLGRNWLHLRDGSGADGAADVTVTTEGAAAVGDLVLARGRVVTKQDFGSGYTYDVLIQDATLER